MRMSQKLVALLFAAISASANAGYMTGNSLNELSQQKETRKFADGMLHGYVAGVVDGLGGTFICPPKGVTIGQITAIVEKYIRANPEDWDLSGDDIVALALQPLYPCAKKK